MKKFAEEGRGRETYADKVLGTGPRKTIDLSTPKPTRKKRKSKTTDARAMGLELALQRATKRRLRSRPDCMTKKSSVCGDRWTSNQVGLLEKSKESRQSVEKILDIVNL